MTASNNTQPRMACAIPCAIPRAVLAAALLAGGVASALAQPAANIAKPATARPAGNAATHKPAEKKRTPATANTAPTSAQSDYWSVNYTLPKQYPVERARPPVVVTEISSEFGRVPVQNGPGTIGFTTQSNFKATEFHDGRTVPGQDPNTRKESSFVGLSLSVPSSSNVLAIPAPNPWNRTE